MASEVTKVSVVDSRILQSKPKFAVEKGPLSLTNVPYRAITATSSQMTFNIIVPSESVFVDRAVDWSTWVYGQCVVTPSGALTAGEAICSYGRDVALAPYPLHQLCATMSATINDTTTVVNTSDVMTQLLRLQDYKKHRKVKTCPSMLDKYVTYPTNGPTLQTNSSINGFEKENNVDEKPNGSWGQFQWTQADGSLPGLGAVNGPRPGGGADYDFLGGVPIARALNLSGPFTLYFRFRSTERLLISPFIFADDHQISTGLFGVQNIQLLMNFSSPAGAGRLLRNALVPGGTGSRTKAVSAVAFNTTATQVATAPFADPIVNIQYLTPSLDVPLPAKSIVPYMDYPRYISQPAGTTIPVTATSGASALTTTGIQSQTITLPAIPDLLIIYVKPANYLTGGNPDPKQGDWNLPITNISVNFDNFAGLLSSHSQEQLYRMSVQNGLEMDWDQWRGYASYAVGTNTGGEIAPADTSATGLTSNQVALTGGPLVLKPGRDIVLQAGQAPSLVGNFTLQFNLQVQNFSGSAVSNAQVFVIAVNSGYFETIKGSSRIIKGVLTEQDILSAPIGPGSSEAHMDRFVGAGMLSDNAESAHAHADGAGRRRRGDNRSGHRMSGYTY
jgi:hypothetical protein